MMNENVKIPLSLLNQTIDLLECIDLETANFDPILLCYHKIVLSAFLKKKQSLELRKSYAKIIFAENEDKQWDARMDYLQKKRHINGGP